jgi:hypothetical protein
MKRQDLWIGFKLRCPRNRKDLVQRRKIGPGAPRPESEM